MEKLPLFAADGTGNRAAAMEDILAASEITPNLAVPQQSHLGGVTQSSGCRGSKRRTRPHINSSKRGPPQRDG